MLAAGALGAAQKGHMASKWFMESPENDARIQTMFPQTMNEEMYMTDADNAVDAQRIEAMHRVHTNFARGDGFLEAAGIAGAHGQRQAAIGVVALVLRLVHGDDE